MSNDNVVSQYKLTDDLVWYGSWNTDLTDKAELAFVATMDANLMDPTKCAIRAIILTVVHHLVSVPSGIETVDKDAAPVWYSYEASNTWANGFNKALAQVVNLGYEVNSA